MNQLWAAGIGKDMALLQESVQGKLRLRAGTALLRELTAKSAKESWKMEARLLQSGQLLELQFESGQASERPLRSASGLEEKWVKSPAR